jgi:hypothetical protein
MSEVFQGIVFVEDAPTVHAFIPSLPPDLEVLALPGGYIALARHRRAIDMAYGNELAAQASRSLGAALHVAYDSRLGLRQSHLFHQGSATTAFGLDTERWHSLGEGGEPDMKRTFSTSELLSTDEYETAEDAVTQGLRAVGLGSLTGQDLVQLVCYRGGA